MTLKNMTISFGFMFLLSLTAYSKSLVRGDKLRVFLLDKVTQSGFTHLVEMVLYPEQTASRRGYFLAEVKDGEVIRGSAIADSEIQDGYFSPNGNFATYAYSSTNLKGPKFLVDGRNKKVQSGKMILFYTNPSDQNFHRPQGKIIFIDGKMPTIKGELGGEVLDAKLERVNGLIDTFTPNATVLTLKYKESNQRLSFRKSIESSGDTLVLLEGEPFKTGASASIDGSFRSNGEVVGYEVKIVIGERGPFGIVPKDILRGIRKGELIEVGPNPYVSKNLKLIIALDQKKLWTQTGQTLNFEIVRPKQDGPNGKSIFAYRATEESFRSALIIGQTVPPISVIEVSQCQLSLSKKNK